MIDWTVSLSFGRLEAALSQMHDIADTKRTAFQARLKNFHRLGYPLGFASAKGKASAYEPGHLVEIALAVEMTQLGLPPERVVHVLVLNRFPTMMAIRMAASALLEKPKGFDLEEVLETDPPSMFLYFDPASLRSLMLDEPHLTPDIDEADDTFFYGGQAIVADNIVKWTSGHKNRLSFINVTAMIDRLAAIIWPGEELEEYTEEYLAFRTGFFRQLHDWADAQHEETYEHEADYYTQKMFEQSYSAPMNDDPAEIEAIIAELIAETGLKPRTIQKAISALIEKERNRGDC